MNRFLRSPAVHFLLIGVVLFVAQSLASGRSTRTFAVRERVPIVVTAEVLAELRARFNESAPGEPTRSQYEYMIRRFVDDETSYREALAMGMDRGDSTVRYRLVEKMEYLGESEEGDPLEETVERAISLGLSRADPMVRGAMIQKYRMLVRFSGFEAPSEAQQRDYYERNMSRYDRPARASIVHVYFSRQERGADQARLDAQSLVARARAGGLKPDELIDDGDVFLMGHTHRAQSHSGMARLFGTDFAQSVLAAQTDGWIGPVESAFGYHAVFVSDVSPEGILEFDSVRSQVLKALEDELREKRLDAKLAELRDQYQVVIEWGDIVPAGEG